jgi:hypothetical protein
MPSTSPAQARMFAAIAHGWHPTGLKHAPSQAVARDFNQADKGSALLSRAMQHRADGGPVSPLAALASNPMTMHSTLPHLGQSLGMAGRMRMPHIPLADTMHNIDQHMSGARMKLPSLKAAIGGGVRQPAASSPITLSPQAVSAIKYALSHLVNRDASSAAATLRSSPEAMQHPVVQRAAHSLRASSGIAPATRSLTGVANRAPSAAGGLTTT